MKSKKNNVYTPEIRTAYDPTDKELTNAYESEYKTKGTNPKKDPVAANNISCPEFDYTEEPY
ncbi:hypothetical protein ACED96_10180 [Clostridium thermobutyricum]|uniref:Uncharacterized protein n=1 Tax=Clostridium thermobutyricum DSM 4928 TaxID=1121339 RepID=A0A1V4SU78_9CLOT|nr:hypothetical protein [Clostridium thermobutyricum]OPX47415.1 hypothetical protein CLTHE_19780 [Clostridium thermobutyricum DSM 4928]